MVYIWQELNIVFQTVLKLTHMKSSCFFVFFVIYSKELDLIMILINYSKQEND